MWKPRNDALCEPPPLPRVAEHPPAGRTLVLAPHPDDETFGMGGTMRLHADQGDRVEVIFLSDGGFGDPDGHFADQDYTALRRAEAAAAAEILGVHDILHYGYPDHHPTVSEAALDDLAGRLVHDVKARSPENLYFPWPGESHQDHWATAAAALRALKRLPSGLRAFGYEVWSALVPDFIVEVTSAVQVKLEAGACYQSQLRYTPYMPITRGLMVYRSLYFKLTPGDPLRYGEAFLEVDRS